MALALRAAFGVRVCSPANAVAQRYPGPSVFASTKEKSLGRLAASCGSPFGPPSAFAFAIPQTQSACAGMTKKRACRSPSLRCGAHRRIMAVPDPGTAAMTASPQDNLSALYPAHLAEIEQRSADALAACGRDT